MYKVFFNDSIIQFDDKSKISSNNNLTHITVGEHYVFVNELIDEMESGRINTDVVLVDEDPNKLWHLFKRQFHKLPAAGGLVMNENRELLFIKRLGVWDLPKGKIEKKESPELAAIREVEEECGISGLKIIRQLDSTFHIYRSPYRKHPDNLILKETKWFLMSCENNQPLVPQTEENIEEVRWFNPGDLDWVLENTYSSIREFLEKTIPLI